MAGKEKSRKGKKGQKNVKEEMTNDLVKVNDDTTLQSFLNAQKEKGKKKLQEVTTSGKGNKMMTIKPSAKQDFPLFYGRNVPNLNPEIIDYLQNRSQKISLSDEEPKEMINEEDSTSK